MIGWLQGRIIEKQQPGKLTIDVNGIGYEIETSLPVFFALEHQHTQIALFIHTVVREDAILLFGFISQEERSLFRSLIKVNGIGPKVALSILSSITPEEFVLAIQNHNINALIRLPGIGKKNRGTFAD